MHTKKFYPTSFVITSILHLTSLIINRCTAKIPSHITININCFPMSLNQKHVTDIYLTL